RSMKHRILIADDDAIQRESVASLLTRWGYEAETAADRKEVVERVHSFQPSAVIVDLAVSGLGGPELLRTLRGELPTASVIVLTSQGTIESAVAAMKEGAFD